ncbi:MAG: FHA domain-containing protein [Gemmatimonadetes bacterium]|nr:FHA domain-containing protein [Gemmatimonadota bacterium]
MSVSVENLLVIVAALATTAFAIVAALWVARRRRDQDLRQHGKPLLVVPSAGVAPAVFAPEPARERLEPLVMRATPEHVAQAAAIPWSGPVSHVEDPITATTGRFTQGTVPAEVVHGHSLRFHRPPDGTLQFFPASLLVIGGPDAGHELRFVHPDAGATADITFGRKDGPPYRHVQLLEPTVSRTHARMSPDGTGWRVVNLSRTNPVVVNGIALSGVDTWHRLKHGDLVEMGALVFRYQDGEAGQAGEGVA